LCIMGDSLPTKAEATAYIQEQQLQDRLAAALNQVVQERAPNATARIGEILMKVGHEQTNVQKLRDHFAMADTDGNGSIGIEELKVFQERIGEPLAAEELQAAFVSMGGADGREISFDAFAKWYQSARAKGGALSRKGDTYSTRAARTSRVSRASKECDSDLLSSFDKRACRIVEAGEVKTLEYRAFMEYPDENGVPQRISPWHDVPLYPAGGKEAGEVHMVVEIPKYSRAKYEIATGEDFNPIKQDVKKGRLREYNYGDMLFNYGCFPQTWEDPAHITKECDAHGDNDPIDAMEIGTQIVPMGSVLRVKVLGCLAMIDDGETDWKVICINTEDPLAKQLDTIGDVEAVIPGLIGVMREWLRNYKIVDGKPPNAFGLEEKALDKAFTLNVVDETHQFWRSLVAKGLKTV